jgi:hypothetical protein
MSAAVKKRALPSSEKPLAKRQRKDSDETSEEKTDRKKEKHPKKHKGKDDDAKEKKSKDRKKEKEKQQRKGKEDKKPQQQQQEVNGVNLDHLKLPAIAKALKVQLTIKYPDFDKKWRRIIHRMLHICYM